MEALLLELLAVMKQVEENTRPKDLRMRDPRTLMVLQIVTEELTQGPGQGLTIDELLARVEKRYAIAAQNHKAWLTALLWRERKRDGSLVWFDGARYRLATQATRIVGS